MTAGPSVARRQKHTFSSYNYQVQAADQAPAWQAARGERYAEYRRLWAEKPARREPGPFPLHLDIETTNNCNLKCVMCPRTIMIDRKMTKWSPKGIGYMDLAAYRRLIDQAAEGGAYSIKLNFLGEPLIHPDVVEHVAYAHAAGLYVMMNTNGVALSAKLARRLLVAGVDDVFFSIDGATADQYGQVRVGARLEKVLRNVTDFVRLKNELNMTHVQTRASMVLGLDGLPDTRQIRQRYEGMFLDLGLDGVGFGECYDPLADHSRGQDRFVSGFACEQLFQRMFVLWDGVYTPCCVNAERDYVLGDTGRLGLAEVWHGPRYRRLRDLHITDRYHVESMCRRCVLPRQFEASLRALEIAADPNDGVEKE
ncbi:MAG: radical SAM protein [Proteobacteria bacterium]|nr:radical SAM protein [Pseudomonadota bacterium]